MSIQRHILRAEMIGRLSDCTIHDLHMECGHVLVSRTFGPDRDNPMIGWRAMCNHCGVETEAQRDLFCEAAA